VSRIYLSPPHLTGEELAFVTDALASNWVAPMGPHVDAFERELAAVVGVGHAAALSSGTAALHLALRLAGVGPGDLVICPTLTFVATANAAVYLGARPLFVDVDPATWTLDPALLEAELAARARTGEQAKAVVTVDLYGQCADYDRIAPPCARYGVPLIEDAAEALGATYRGRAAGACAPLGVFSFNGNKIITTSGGGMLVGDDGEAIAEARRLAAQAREPAAHYEHATLGYNYRLSNLLAAVGRAQLAALPQRVARKWAIGERYRACFAGTPGVSFMAEAPYGTSSRWLTCVLIDPAAFGATAEAVWQALERQDVEARPLWKPLHLQPVFAGCARRGGAVAEALFERGLCLPSGTALSDGEIDRIAGIVLAQRGSRVAAIEA
jgi:pyridoxal phosphate-dependent aminotransferase EpsN